MSADIVPFAFEGVEVRTLDIDGETWWIAADVCAALGLSNPSMAIAPLDDDEKGLSTVETPGGYQSLVIISEPGLYALLARSRKPVARKFDRWVRHDVLTEINRTGTFNPPTVREIPQDFATALREFAREIEAHEATQAALAAATPRAEAWDAIASAEGDYSVGDAAKILARRDIVTGPTRLFEQLHTLGWTFRGEGGKWRAYQDRVDRGYLAERPQFHYHPRTKELVTDPPQLRVTIKGLERLRQVLGATALKAVTR